ncbi:hypothetical protein ACFV9C_44600 [Kribbella sp. NPDC059898]|uniref:hypothetical protein n=1 Tax=Kribbella sp. NPDC059898 TaxID=3346995 RepID=UPI0036629205
MTTRIPRRTSSAPRDHGPTLTFTSQPVKDLNDRRRVAYWRWYADGIEVGAVAPKPDGFRALIYRRDIEGRRITELGVRTSRREAEEAVRDWATANPGRVKGEQPT